MDMAAGEVEMRGRTRERDSEVEDEATTTETISSPAVKRKKLEEEEEEVDGESRMISMPLVNVLNLTNNVGITARDLGEPPESSVVGRASSDGDQCQSPSSEDNPRVVSISCCSNDGFGDKLNGRIEFQDLGEDNNVAETGTSRHYSCSTRNQSSQYCEPQEETESMESASAAGEVQPSDAAECRRRSTVSEAEVEEFFVAAEKDLRCKIFECSKKYNFDFVKEEALDGRYDWVKLKP